MRAAGERVPVAGWHGPGAVCSCGSARAFGSPSAFSHLRPRLGSRSHPHTEGTGGGREGNPRTKVIGQNFGTELRAGRALWRVGCAALLDFFLRQYNEQNNLVSRLLPIREGKAQSKSKAFHLE